jgi:hypothetical protein
MQPIEIKNDAIFYHKLNAIQEMLEAQDEATAQQHEEGSQLSHSLTSSQS